MAEDLTSAKNLLKLAIDLQNLCENTDNKEINKNILSIKFKILFLIQEYGQISPSTLVEELKIAKSNIALFCKQLIIEQLIISKQDDFDHRIIYYCLTKKGEKYVCNYLNLLNKHICQTFEENKLKTLDKNVKSISDIFLKTGVKIKMLKLYNSLTNKKEDFKPVEEGLVKMYTCGPTVYYYQHIGNMRAYIFMDSLRRTIKYNGYKINGVMNVTDVGHLTSDEDSGEDKMEKAAKKENKSPYEIAKFYADIYFEDLKLLNIDVPEHITYATKYIPQMIEFVKGLEKKGYTYRIEDGIYFDVKSFPGYGQLSQKDLDKPGNARIEENSNKHHPFDFALWKFVPDNHIMKWDSPWGVGCPGWHIECSAMSKNILGDKFDIHTGGIDHKTVHHEDEIAQNDALAGHRVVNTWMHNEFLLVDGGKMSKSLGNVYTIANLRERGFEPLDFKYFCLNTHYSKKINFTFEGLKASAMGYKKLKTTLLEHKNGTEKVDAEVLKEYKQKFLDAINDDLNFPLAIGVMWTMLRNEKKSNMVYKTALEFDKALGLNLDVDEKEKEEETIPQHVKDLAEARLLARSSKKWEESDRLRDKIKELGYAIKDSKDGYELEKI